MTGRDDKRKQRAAQLAVALALFAVAIYGVVFIKMPVWLPALK